MKTSSLRLAPEGVLGASSIARPAQYAISVPNDERRTLAICWLGLGIFALVASGAFSLLLVLARTPYIGTRLPFVDVFHTALVIHVDLSVLVWFAAFGAMLWTLNGARAWLPLAWATLALAVIGTAFMVAAPFISSGLPIMANYVPVLDQPAFLYGLTLFGLAMLLASVRSLGRPEAHLRRLDGPDAVRIGLNAAVFSAAIAIFAFAWSWLEVPDHLTGKAYYEMLFWGGGHVLQFTWTLLMLVAWLWLASHVGARLPISPRVVALVFAIGVAVVLLAPAIYVRWPVPSIEHNRMFTWLMRFGGGLAILPFALGVTIGLTRAPVPARDKWPALAALLASMILFAAGGVIGFMINGSDVRVPAHYHGSIVGVTLALMGLGYVLLVPLGFRAPHTRLATWQPVLYGGGQLLHILGLVWSGGYGVQRKVAGTEQLLRTTSEVFGMGLMGLGGLIAITGGLLFVVIVAGAMLRTSPRAASEA